MQTILNPSMQEAADALIGNLLASEAFVRYQLAQARLNDDQQAQALLKQLSQAQAKLRNKQANSHLSKEEIESLRAMQGEVQSNEVIKAYAQAQHEAVNLLRELNGEVSQLLGINFASFANHATC